MRISDWSSDVCSSDLRQMIEYPFPYERDQRLWAGAVAFIMTVRVAEIGERDVPWRLRARHADRKGLVDVDAVDRRHDRHIIAGQAVEIGVAVCAAQIGLGISPPHHHLGRPVAPPTSELQSLMRL